MTQCNACGGRYFPAQRDGIRYYHVCPPRSRVELARLLVAGTLGYPPGTTAATFAGVATPVGSAIPGWALAAADGWLQVRSFRRPNHRDENIAAVAADGTVTIVADGAGVTIIPDPPPFVQVA